MVARESSTEKAKATIVLLHGWGSDAKLMIDSAAPLIPDDFRIVSLQGPIEAPQGKWMWYRNGPEGPVSSTLVEALSRLESTLDPEAGLIARDAPIFLVGFSQGGSLALAFSTLRYNWMSGVACVSGILLDDRTLPGPIGVLRGKPVLIVHGRADTVWPLGIGRAAVRRLKAAGAIVEFMEHDGAHMFPPEAWSRIAAWVKASLPQAQTPISSKYHSGYTSPGKID